MEIIWNERVLEIVYNIVIHVLVISVVAAFLFLVITFLYEFFIKKDVL